MLHSLDKQLRKTLCCNVRKLYLSKNWECSDFHIRSFQEKIPSFSHDSHTQGISSDSPMCFPMCWFTKVSLSTGHTVAEALEPSFSSAEREVFFFIVFLECANVDQGLFLNYPCGQKVKNIPESNHNDR